MLPGAPGGKVYGQPAGKCGYSHANASIIKVLAVTMWTFIQVYYISFFKGGVSGPWLFLVISLVIVLLR